MYAAFKQYLSNLKLSPVSRKLYLSDVRRFLSWLAGETGNQIETLDISSVTSGSSYTKYLTGLQAQAIAPSMLKRTIASLRQFGAFLSLTYSVPNPMHSATLSPLSNLPSPNHDYIKHFTNYLNSQHLSPLTIKSYKSDMTRYIEWAATHLPSTKITGLLSNENSEKYLNHLTESVGTLPSTIERKDKSINRFKAWYETTYAPVDMPDNTKSWFTRRVDAQPEPSMSMAQPSTLTPPDKASFFVKNFNYRSLITLAVLLVFSAALGIFGYRQFSRDVNLTAAFPSTPITPNRQLSFQGRLEDAGGTPITTATNLTFKLWDDPSAGSQLYTTGVCSITPDSDGVFSTQIGGTCGSAITSSVFTENANVYLEVTVAAETLAPRQQIASVAYALNSETIQGFPISSTVSAIRNTVVPMNQWGEIIVGEQSPRLKGVSGTFQISAPSLSLITTAGTNGNISIAPDGTGQVNLTGNTTTTNFFNVSNAQLTTGSLITGTAANNNTGFKLIDLLSGSSPTSKFSVTDTGLTTVGDDLYLSSGLSTFGTAVSSGTLEATKFCTGDGETNCLTDFSALGTGDITAVGSMVSGDTFANSSADDDWLGLGASAGRIEFDDQTVDEINFLNSRVGIGTSTPGYSLDVSTTTSARAINVNNIQTVSSNVYGVISNVNITDGAFTSTAYGGYFTANENSGNSAIGVYGNGGGTVSGDSIGVFGESYTGTGIKGSGIIGGDFVGGVNGIIATAADDTGSTGADISAYGDIDLIGADVYTNKTGDTAADTYGINNYVLNVGNVTTGTDSTYGQFNSVARTGSTAANLETYGSYISVTGDNGGAGTHNAYGIYVEMGAGPDNVYAGIFNGGNVGIGTSAPDAALEINHATGDSLRLTYNDSNGSAAEYADFSISSSGDLTINPQGNLTITTDGTGNGEVVLPNDAIGPDELLSTGQTDEYCLTYETGDTLEWQTCGVGGGGGSNWRYNLGALSPLNDTVDLLVGGNATSSAKAGFININSGTPTATVSAGTSGAAYLTAAGTLATTAKQSLILGNTTTGNVVIAPGGVTALTAIGANLTAAGNVTLGSAANLIFGGTNLAETTAANDSGAYLVGTFDEFANSNSLNVQDVLDDLDAVLSTALTGSTVWTDAGAYLYPTSAEVLGNSASGGANKIAGIYLADSSPLVFGTDNDFTFSFNNSSSTLGSTLTSGTRLGINTTSALATVDIRSSLGTIPVASISGNTSMAALVVDQSGTGDIFTASASGNPRFVVKNNGNVGIGVNNPTNKLEIGGSTSTLSNNAGDITIDSASNNISLAGDSLINILNTYVSGELGVGVSDAIGRFHVHGATTGKALSIFNELGDQDILVASSSGTTRARLTNSGSLSLDGDYINFGLTDGSTGYGFRDNGGTLQFKHNSGSWADVGSGGGSSWWGQTAGTLQPYNATVDLLVGGTATASAKFGLINVNSGTPTATISAGAAGGIYINATGKIATTAKQTLALGDSSTTGNIILQGGNVGIGVASPVQKLEVNGYIVGQRFEDSSSASYYVDPAAAGTSVSIDGDIVSNGVFSISSNGNNNITINAGSGTVLIGSAGAGKLDAGTIDPPYTINGEKFATYVSGMTGVKEETTGVVQATTYIPGSGYRATLDFAGALSGSDLWLFSKASSLKNQLDRLVVLLSASNNTKTWYELDAAAGQLHLFAQSPTTISYRLTAPRYDATTWLNTRGEDSASVGHVINDEDSWTVPESIANMMASAAGSISQTISDLVQTDMISPIASDSAIMVNGPLHIQPLQGSVPCNDQLQGTEPCNSDPLLVVDGEIVAATISARVAKLTDVQAENITAKNIVADTITANTIIGLDAKIASLSGLTDQEFDSITDRIKARLALLTGSPTAEDIPAPEGVSSTGDLAGGQVGTPEVGGDSLSATSSASLSSADIDFVTINNYLAVIGTATITSLDVTNELYTSSINSKTGLLALGDNILIVDNTGNVMINGDLTVNGRILAESASINSLEIGTPAEASASALGNLLSIYNEQGRAVATIDASGSANIDTLATQQIIIASSGNSATDSSALSTLIGTATSNATAGVATLTSPNTELTIESPYITQSSLVYLTPTTNTDNKVLFVKSKQTCNPSPSPSEASCVGGFTVGIDAPANSDLSFNWWIIELKL